MSGKALEYERDALTKAPENNKGYIESVPPNLSLNT